MPRTKTTPCRLPDLPAIGSSPSPWPTSPLDRYSKRSIGQRDSWKKELEGSDTGKWSSDLGNLFDYQLSSPCSQRLTLNPPDLMQPKNMSGRMTPVWDPVLRSALSPSNEIPPTTGRSSVGMLKPAIWMGSPMMSLYVITGISEELLVTLQEQFQWSEPFSSSGVEAVAASHAAPGTKLAWTLIVRIPALSGGAVIEANKLLSSMSFEVQSESLTCCAGLTATQCVWKPRGLRYRYLPIAFGLPQTWTQDNGTRT